MGMQTKIITNNKLMLSLLSEIEMIRNSDCPVLIIGETGTGKELLADYIHSNSKRNEKKFVKVSLSSLPSSLFESELFGHEKGAYTGADHSRIGFFEAANHATIYLDDIDDFPLHLQPKLLRVIENKELIRIGSNEPLPIDTRIISSSKVELKELIDNKNFRSDLFYRLSVFTLHLPPLRERKDDIPLLFNYFLDHHKTPDEKLIKITNLNLEPLLDYSWQGNVRELRNFSEKLTLYPESQIYDNFENIFKDFVVEKNIKSNTPDRNDRILQDNQSFEERVSLFEMKLISNALERSYGNVNLSSKLLKIKPSTLRDKIKKLNIDPSEFKI